MVMILLAHSSPGAPELCARSQFFSVHHRMKGPWNRVYRGLGPGSKPNNMATFMKVNVSPQIDNLTNTMNFYKENPLTIR